MQNIFSGSKEERFKIINLLLKNGANPNQFGATCDCREIQIYKYKITPIVVAICLNESNLVKLLIEHGADIPQARPFNTVWDNVSFRLCDYMEEKRNY